MENASRAILMAGGILISLIVISIFYYMFSQISEFRDKTSVDTTEQETLDFNQSFEAYNKKVMYGADVISVLNKAIDNNKKYDVETENNNGYYVDVVIKFTNDLQTRIETYTKTETGYEKSRTDNVDIVFRKNTEYSLSNDKEKIKALLIDAIDWKDTEEGKTYKNSDSSISTYKPGIASYTITYYPAAEFKRNIFYCSGVEYHNDTGRVSKMTFIEKT